MQALRGEPISIYGDGTQTRSFCYISDLVNGLIRLMQSARELSGPINLGNPSEYTMRELAATIARLCGTELRLEFRPSPADHPRQRRPDITRAREQLGWQPTVPLAEGLRPTIDYFRRFVR
jgi:UDP-glucuronate decarboxylase